MSNTSNIYGANGLRIKTFEENGRIYVKEKPKNRYTRRKIEGELEAHGPYGPYGEVEEVSNFSLGSFNTSLFNQELDQQAESLL